MDKFLLVVSYFLLNVIISLLYVVCLLLLFSTMKKVFNMNEDKWSALFTYRNGKGLSCIMVFPFFLVIALIFPVSMSLFKVINFDYPFLGYVAVIMLPAFLLVFNLPKLKLSMDTK